MSAGNHRCAGTTAAGQGLICAALKNPQTNEAIVDDLAKADIRPFRECFVVRKCVTNLSHIEIYYVVDEDDAMWIAHGDRHDAVFIVPGR